MDSNEGWVTINRRPSQESSAALLMYSRTKQKRKADHLALIPIDRDSFHDGERRSWQVQFARNFISPQPVHPPNQHLVPLPGSHSKIRSPGAWISTRSDTASLQLGTDLTVSSPSSPFLLLTVLFQGSILEKHCASKLHFSWPHVSCVSGFPSRGSRAVIVSYKDSNNKIQKFALRFPSSSEAGSFIRAIEKNPSENDEHSAACISDKSTVSSDSNAANEQPPCEDAIYPHFPPSFTSLLDTCHSPERQAANEFQLPDDEGLKALIEKYMEDSAFQDLLMRVDKVIHEFEDENLHVPV